MWRYVGYALLLISLLSFLTWGVNLFITRLLPFELNSSLILFFATLTTVLGSIAAFKDTLELIRFFSTPSGKTSLKLVSPPSTYMPREMNAHVDLDITSIQVVETLSSTTRSVIEKCLIKGRPYIVKRTIAGYCHIKALKQIVGKNYTGRAGAVTTAIATPLAVWEAGGYVWELHHIAEGVTLRDFILNNQFHITGELLDDIYISLLLAVNQFHTVGILHRDISPSNLLILGEGRRIKITLIDCSFCCIEHEEQIPIDNPNYSAPEQKVGKAQHISDWYSIAATIFFIVNGTPPDWYDRDTFEGKVKNLGRLIYIISSLLNPDISNRPSMLADIMLKEITKPLRFDQEPILVSLLEMANGRYIAILDEYYRIIEQEDISDFLSKTPAEGENLKRYTKTIIRKSK